ncbi:MAG: PDZ domain-containing protein [Planctomycetota bacterium]|jgi:hypothetical protein
MVSKFMWSCVVLFLVVPALAGETPEEKKPGEAALRDRIEGLVARLGSEAWKERKAAEKELIRIGIPAVPALEKALKSDDPEVRVRARRALDRIRENIRPPRKVRPPGVERDEFTNKDKAKKKKPEPFPVPDPFGEDFADMIKRLLEDPFPRRDREDWKAWEKEFEKRMREGPFGKWEEKLTELLKELEKDVPGLRNWTAAEKHAFSKNGRTVEVERTAKGEVKVVLHTKDDEGRPKVERFSAPNEKIFREKHPDVYEKYVKGRLSRSPIVINPGQDPWGEWRKKVDEMLRRHRKAFDPDKIRRDMDERMRRFRREPWSFRLRGKPGSTRVFFRDGDVSVDLERTDTGRIRLILRKRDEQGRIVEDRYEEASEEAFRKKFPKIHEKYVKGKISKRGVRLEFSPRSPRIRFGARPDRSRFGITTEGVSELVRVHLNLEEGVGFIVKAVVPGSKADRAGFKKYDLVLKAGGLYVTRPSELEDKIENAEGPVEVELIRRGERMTLSVGK